MPPSDEAERTPRRGPRISCGVESCLTCSMVLFAVLLVGMVVLVLWRLTPTM